MRRTLSILTATGAIALGIAACGGSSGAASSAPSSSTSSAAAATTSSAGAAAAASSKLSISAPKSGALMFDTKTLSAKAGTVTVTFTNQSTEGHNFTVADASGKVIGATPTFEGGSKTLTLHVKAGKYTYYCSVPGHRQAGMQGTLTVS